jgi:hypothetical protein
LQLDVTGITANARALVEFELGGEAAVFLSAWFANNGIGEQAGEPERLKIIDRIFGSADVSDAEVREFELLGKAPAAIVQPYVEKLRSEVRRWMMNRIDDPSERLSGAKINLQWIDEQVRALAAELNRRRGDIADKLLGLRREVAAPADAAPARDLQRVYSYFHLRLEHLAAFAAEHAVSVLHCDAKAMSDELTDFGREIDQIAAAMNRAANTNPSNELHSAARSSDADAELAAALRLKLPSIAVAVDARLQVECINTLGGLINVVMQGGRPRAQLAAKLYELSRQAVYDTIAGISLLEKKLGEDAASATNELRSGLAAATPALLAFGGRRRVLAVLPRDGDCVSMNPLLSRTIGAEVTAVPGSDMNVTLCVEADGLSLTHIAAEFIENRRDRIAFAARVHSRNDIAWIPLIPTGAATASNAWSEALIETESQQAMCKTLVM